MLDCRSCSHCGFEPRRPRLVKARASRKGGEGIVALGGWVMSICVGFRGEFDGDIRFGKAPGACPMYCESLRPQYQAKDRKLKWRYQSFANELRTKKAPYRR